MVDNSGNCGNMLSAIGPFAVDEGLLPARGDGDARVRIHNTNTGKLVHVRFAITGGRAAVEGECAIPGATGVGSPVTLEFLSPGGATTGLLLPTGSPVDMLDVPGVGRVAASLVDAANACCFLRAADFGLTGAEPPATLDAAPDLLAALARVRVAASVAMGVARDPTEAARRRAVPYIVLVAAPRDATTLSGAAMCGADADLAAQALSSGQPHRALPLTAALCLAAAARIDGTLPQALAAHSSSESRTAAAVRIATPSGVLAVGADVHRDSCARGGWRVERAEFLRTQRRLFDGFVCVPAVRVPRLAAALAGAGLEM